MHKSKLESYEAILGALANGPLGIDRLAYKVSMDCSMLSEHLTFMMANEVVEERDFGDKTLFAITERGVTVFRTLDFQKYLKKLSKVFLTTNEAIQDMSVVPRRRQKSPK